MYVSALEVNYSRPSPVTIDRRRATPRKTPAINIATNQRNKSSERAAAMKMEVLARNQQFQAAVQQQQQFDGIGSTKATDWTKPLTPPTSAIHHHHHHQQDPPAPQPRTDLHLSPHTAEQLLALPHPHHHRHHYQQLQRHQHHQQQRLKQQQLLERQQQELEHEHRHLHHPDHVAIAQLSLKLQAELRAAKTRNLACTEVLLPADLLDRIATDMVQMAEKEPCGIRGCAVYIEFEDEPGNSRRIASMQCAAGTVATFELYLTLRNDQSGWTAKLPQFLKNLARRSTIIISRDYALIKNKLYNSFLE